MYFNLFNLLIFFGALQGIIIGIVLLFFKKKEDQSTLFLSWLIFSLSLTIGKHFLIDFSKANQWDIIVKPPVSCFLLMGPFLFFYVRATLGKKIKTNIKFFIHLIPGLIFLVIQLIIFIESGFGEELMDQSIISIFQLIEQVLGLLSLMIYGYLSLKLVIKYQKKITEFYSNIEYITLQWLINLLIGLFIGWLFLLFLTMVDLFVFDFTLPQSAYYLLFIYVGVIIHYFGLRKLTMIHFPTLRPLEVLEKKPDIQKNDIESDKDEDTKEIQKLEKIMVENKPFLDPNLTLDSLSDLLGVHSKKLSMILNQKMGTSFYDFINKARVEEVKVKIADPGNDHLTILGIALDSGFNSKSSFNAIFKKYTGMTPRQYKNTL
ncbi:helix-turn-helix domain-containing protein [Mangrovivirga cuniculi]|uniref:HTH araC/xylS-type domain-containing protein n=1 Tax=Mangrovivirga cuniculi TaxID=2715131 RepID=A0A4D7JDV6_9BACT|nr:helix-turn-helix domain-containing protein [Mangrovivirga cuniculi]QCK13861.1 hypothetical protein DCC35_03345 [Mangrovivirga cuniculi]